MHESERGALNDTDLDESKTWQLVVYLILHITNPKKALIDEKIVY